LIMLFSIILAVGIYVLISNVMKIDEFVQVKSSLVALVQNRKAE
jgi:hypothetical protein